MRSHLCSVPAITACPHPNLTHSPNFVQSCLSPSSYFVPHAGHSFRLDIYVGLYTYLIGYSEDLFTKILWYKSISLIVKSITAKKVSNRHNIFPVCPLLLMNNNGGISNFWICRNISCLAREMSQPTNDYKIKWGIRAS